MAKMVPNETDLNQQIRDAVVEAYLETGKAQDAKEIATRLGWSPTKVRRIITAAHGSVDGIAWREEHRQSFSRNYTFMASGSHKVSVYSPTLQTLRELILKLRAPKTP